MKIRLFILALIASSCRNYASDIDYLPAAKSGDAAAQAIVASAYESGTEVPQNFALSFYWYSRAAAQTNSLGEIGVLNAYYLGRGVPESQAIADALTVKMASEGNVPMQLSAGLMFASRGLRARETFRVEPIFTTDLAGSPYQTNFIQAYKWLSLASAGGSSEAARRRDELLGQMTPESIALGQRLAGSFAPRPRTGLQFTSDGRLVFPPSPTQPVSRAPLAAAPTTAQSLLTRQCQQASNGVPSSQFGLGLRYIKGDGVETNRPLGLYWIYKAAYQDFPDAKEFLRTYKPEQQ